MRECGALICESTTADFKCARCQGVFYCNAACQKADWKRHKRFCKPLPRSAAGSTSIVSAVRRGRVSASEDDAVLLRALHALVVKVSSLPTSIREELPPVLELTKALLARGARPDVLVRASDGVPSSISLAILCQCHCQGMEPLLRVLLDAEMEPPVDVNAACEPATGTLLTPLYCATSHHRPSMIRLLVEHGVDVRAPCGVDSEGRLFWPVYVCVLGIRDDLTSNRSTDGALETLDYLLSAGADVDAFDDRGLVDSWLYRTPLVMALHCPDLPAGRAVLDAVAMKLINAGADVHARDHMQTRALDLASLLPSLDVFKALLAKGSDPTPTPYLADRVVEHQVETVKAGTHYLQVAAENGRVDVLQAAVAAGVNLKKARTLGYMAIPLLAHAAYHGEFGAVRFLMEYGCDVNEVYEGGEGKLTACDHFVDVETGVYANVGVAGRMLALLLAAGGKPYAEL